MENQKVEVGQVWRDRDWRLKGERFIRILSVDGGLHALCQTCNEHGASTTHRVTKIKLSRFRPTSTGYDLVSKPA